LSLFDRPPPGATRAAASPSPAHAPPPPSLPPRGPDVSSGRRYCRSTCSTPAWSASRVENRDGAEGKIKGLLRVPRKRPPPKVKRCYARKHRLDSS
jgi:hypothetical protein